MKLALTIDVPAHAQKTVFRTHDPGNGDRYVRLLELDGVSLSADAHTQLTIDGESWAVVRSEVTIDTRSPACVLTVITVVKIGNVYGGKEGD